MTAGARPAEAKISHVGCYQERGRDGRDPSLTRFTERFVQEGEGGGEREDSRES